MDKDAKKSEIDKLKSKYGVDLDKDKK